MTGDWKLTRPSEERAGRSSSLCNGAEKLSFNYVDQRIENNARCKERNCSWKKRERDEIVKCSVMVMHFTCKSEMYKFGNKSIFRDIRVIGKDGVNFFECVLYTAVEPPIFACTPNASHIKLARNPAACIRSNSNSVEPTTLQPRERCSVRSLCNGRPHMDLSARPERRRTSAVRQRLFRAPTAAAAIAEHSLQ